MISEEDSKTSDIKVSEKEVIFIINSPYPNYAGGIENWLNNISHQVKDKLKVTILSIDNNEYPVCYNVEDKSIDYLKVKTISSFVLLRKFVRSYIALLDIIIASWLMGKKLKKCFPLSDHFVDIICLDTMYCVSAALALKKRNPNVRVISSARCPHAEMYSLSFPLLQKYFLNLEKRMLSQVDRIWANGDDTMEILKRKGFNSTLMLNGVNFKKFSLASVPNDFDDIFCKRPSVINLATLLPIKGIGELLEAANYVINTLKVQVNFVFIGKGDPSPYIQFAKSKNIYNYTYFLGHKSNPHEYLKLGKIATCLSGGSGLSMAAIESMASGIPTIAVDTPVYQQFNKEHNYLKLVKEKDPVALGSLIVEILNNYDYYTKEANIAQRYATRFDWTAVAGTLINKLETTGT